MKRHKRDMNQRAFEKGYQAGISGRSSDLCPHTAGQHRNNWLMGWHEGRADQWDGYTGLTACHKLSGFQ
jgi:ribosome modulation factor